MNVSAQDLLTIGLLVFLEGILSIDNALVMAILARDLPRKQQKKALTYGLVGAVVFRLIALLFVTRLIRWTWVKFVGGGYLVLLAVRHFMKKWSGKSDQRQSGPKSSSRSFWRTVVAVELTDIAFAVDSILAAVALSSKFWVVFTGGILGVVMMRFAASLFLKLLARFPGFETTAYLLVLIIGIKVVLEGLHLPGIEFHSASSSAFWVFWGVLLVCIPIGFRRPASLVSSSRKTH